MTSTNSRRSVKFADVPHLSKEAAISYIESKLFGPDFRIGAWVEIELTSGSSIIGEIVSIDGQVSCDTIDIRPANGVVVRIDFPVVKRVLAPLEVLAEQVAHEQQMADG